VDVRDVSTDDVRIALELKKDADERMVMAYLLHFRLEVVTKRLEHELAALRKRLHILEGFEKIFDALDDILKIVRKWEGKADAAQQIMKKYDLDAEQTDAILELKIYRLARLEILVIRKELEDKRRRVRQISTLLKDESARWDVVRVELEEIQKKDGDARRTSIASDEGEVEYHAALSQLPPRRPTFRLLRLDRDRRRARDALPRPPRIARREAARSGRLRGPLRTARSAPLRPGDSLVAHRFDDQREELVGHAEPLGIALPGRVGVSGQRSLAVSNQGTLVYRADKRSATRLVWVNRRLPSGRTPRSTSAAFRLDGASRGAWGRAVPHMLSVQCRRS
jgi:hypothetical protein